MPEEKMARSSSGRPPVRSKILYGVGGLALAIRHTTVGTFLLPFYTDVVLLHASWTGIALALGRIWDGINDPIVGYLSDNTHTRWGRRRPYLLGSALPLGATFFLLWSPSLGLSDLGKFFFLAGTYMVMDTFLTLFATPYLALGAEMSPEYHERTQIVTIRAVFYNLGALTGGAAPMLIVRSFSDPHDGFVAMGAALGGLMAFATLMSFLGGRELPSPPPNEAPSPRGFVADLSSTLGNRPFRIVLATFTIMTMGGAIHQALTVYVFRYWLNMEHHIPAIMVTYLTSVTISLAMWTRLARRLGKNRAFQVCMVWSVTVLTLLPLLRQGMPVVLIYLFIVLAGIGAGGFVLPTSIAADVIDYDEVVTDKRREGAFFGLWTLFMKLAAAGSVAFTGFALDLIGYVPNQPQPAATIFALKLLYGPLPAAFLLLAFLIFRGFPITQDTHREIQKILAARKAGGAQPRATAPTVLFSDP